MNAVADRFCQLIEIDSPYFESTSTMVGTTDDGRIEPKEMRVSLFHSVIDAQIAKKSVSDPKFIPAGEHKVFVSIITHGFVYKGEVVITIPEDSKDPYGIDVTRITTVKDGITQDVWIK